jgi:hypothetical protein
VIVRCAFFALAAVLFAMPASADDDLAGVWSFTTEPTAFNCVISGEVTIKPVSSRQYSCTFTAVQACTERLPNAIHTEQSCSAVKIGRQVSITSKVERITGVDPASMRDLVGYAPDDFRLTLNANGDEMRGRYSSNRSSPARFWRKRELIS